MSTRAPHEIRAADGSAVYHCRVCRTEEALQWFNGTSCPVCKRPECVKELWAEYDAAYLVMGEDE